MTREQFFLNALDDIRSKMNGNEYDLIMVCGLLRQLLCDDKKLIDTVKGRNKLKLKFNVCSKKHPDNYFLAYWTDLSYLKEGAKEVSIDGLLSSRVFTLIDIHFTVKDVIRAGANIQGGVHSGVGKSHEEKIFSVLDDKVFREQNFGKKSIKSICSVVLDGLKPLEDLIKERTSTGGF